MASLSVQQIANASPVLVIILLFGVGIIIFLAARILMANVGCLVRVGGAMAIMVMLFLLLRFLLFHV